MRRHRAPIEKFSECTSWRVRRARQPVDAAALERFRITSFDLVAVCASRLDATDIYRSMPFVRTKGSSLLRSDQQPRVRGAF